MCDAAGGTGSRQRLSETLGELTPTCAEPSSCVTVLSHCRHRSGPTGSHCHPAQGLSTPGTGRRQPSACSASAACRCCCSCCCCEVGWCWCCKTCASKPGGGRVVRGGCSMSQHVSQYPIVRGCTLQLQHTTRLLGVFGQTSSATTAGHDRSSRLAVHTDTWMCLMTVILRY